MNPKVLPDCKDAAFCTIDVLFKKLCTTVLLQLC